MGIVEEFEKTISQLISEKERESVCNVIARERLEESNTQWWLIFLSCRLQTERAQILEDLQAVERAFNDLHRKYERTKEVVAGFKSNEDILKRTVEDLTVRFVKNLSWTDHLLLKFVQVQERRREVWDAERACWDQAERVSLKDSCFYQHFCKRQHFVLGLNMPFLFRASSRMEEVTKTKGVEIARLTAQLRKAEMMVTSLERQVDQKVGYQ